MSWHTKLLKLIIIFTIFVLVTIYLYSTYQHQSDLSLKSTNMKITSSEFISNQTMPAKYTCDGENINPPLNFSDIPANTQSLVLIVDDPDAPAGDWVHWLVWNILPETNSILAGTAPANSTEGTTSFGQPGYGGPCPPSGTHRYFFKLFALDTVLDLKSSANKSQLKQAMQNHILDQTELIGLYSREK